MTRNGNCPHLDILEVSLSELYSVKQGYPCAQCDFKGRNLWICLYRRCMHIGCSEHDHDHGTKHFRANQTHCLQLNLSTRRIWCYVCNTEVFLHTKGSAMMQPADSGGQAARRDSASSNGSVHQHQQHQFHYSRQPADSYSDSEDDLGRGGPPPSADGVGDSGDECGLIGLKNIANTCYMNAALQALSNAPPLHGYFMDCGDIVEASTELQMERASMQPYLQHNQQKRMVGLARSYHRLVKDMWSRSRRSAAGAGAGPSGGGFIVPSGILNGIRTVQAMFRGYHQHDTQEFLRCFMEQLHQELQEETPSPPDYVYSNHAIVQSSNPPPPPLATASDDQRSSQCSSPTQSLSEGEYETCDSGVSEQSSLSEENLDHHNQQQQQQQHQHKRQTTRTPSAPASPTLSFRRYAKPRAGSPSATSGSSYHSANGTSTNTNGHPNATHQRQKPGKDGDNASASVDSTASSHADADADSASATTNTANRTPHKRSIISDVFDGKLLSSVQCLTCDRVSTREENFQDLSLPIPGKDHLSVLHHQSGGSGGPSHPFGSTGSLASTGSSLFGSDAAYHLAAQAAQSGWFWWLWQWVCSFFWGPAVSLYDCMAAFFSADELKGDNMYSCDRCKKLRNGIKYSRVLQLPEMLCVHLKRFRHDLSYSSKIAVPVHFPLHGLDMAAYVHADCRSRISTYDLTAVICHHGTVGGGHYTCMARHPRNGRWYEYDDQLVTEVAEETVAGCEAYVLFYRKSNEHMVEVRQQALALLVDVYPPATPPVDAAAADLRFYVSKQWLNKFNTFAEPGPIDNWTLLCEHGALPPVRAVLKAQLLVAMPQPLWHFLYARYGGGPVINHLYECDDCAREAASLAWRQRTELAAFQRYKEETTATLYAISMRWLREWQDFVAGASGDPQRPPGPISNAAIAGPLQRDEAGRPLVLRSVRTGSDYAQVNSMLWRYFHGVYGGGPVIVMRGQPEEDELVAVGEVESDELESDVQEDEQQVNDGEQVPGVEDEQLEHSDHCDREEEQQEEEHVNDVARVIQLVNERAQRFCNEADDDEDDEEVIVEICTPDADDATANPELTMRLRSKPTKYVSFEDDDHVVANGSGEQSAGDNGGGGDVAENGGLAAVATRAATAEVLQQQEQWSSRHNGRQAEHRTEAIVSKRDRRHRGGITSNGMFGVEGKYSSTNQPADDEARISAATIAQPHHSKLPADTTLLQQQQQQLNGYRSANGAGGSGEPEATVARATAVHATTDTNTNHTAHVPMTTNLRKAQHKMRKKLKTGKSASSSRHNHNNKSHHYQSTAATNGQ